MTMQVAMIHALCSPLVGKSTERPKRWGSPYRIAIPIVKLPSVQRLVDRGNTFHQPRTTAASSALLRTVELSSTTFASASHPVPSNVVRVPISCGLNHHSQYATRAHSECPIVVISSRDKGRSCWPRAAQFAQNHSTCRTSNAFVTGLDFPLSAMVRTGTSGIVRRCETAGTRPLLLSDA